MNHAANGCPGGHSSNSWMEKSRKLLLRAAEQFGQAQFHCGRPPPAALPRIWIRINPEFSESDNHVRSNRTRVAGALEKDRNGFHRWFDPPLFGSSHKCFIRWGAFHLSLCSTEICGTKFPNTLQGRENLPPFHRANRKPARRAWRDAKPRRLTIL